VTVQQARHAYAVEARSLMRMLRDHATGLIPAPLAVCGPCAMKSQYVDAASISLDMAVAERIAGRRPSIEWRREGVAF